MSVTLATALCSAKPPTHTIVYLRTGQSITGTPVSLNDQHVVLKTTDALVTQQWRACTPSTIKSLHPTLYDRLVKQAEERKKQSEAELRAKGFVNLHGKWLPKEQALELLYGRIRLLVSTTEAAQPYTQSHKIRIFSELMKSYDRAVRGVLTLRFDDLDPSRQYRVKVLYTHYLRDPHGSDKLLAGRPVIKHALLHGKYTAELRYETPPYVQTKTTYHGLLDSYSDSSGPRASGWDIAIWIDDVLVYEAVHGKPPVYHYVRKW
ncbi:MAG: hypothetical protein N2595_00815 [bacterium]|nr:hypothetical protein [bacterium]